jgi:DNA-binding MarR family transcriptional regulator
MTVLVDKLENEDLVQRKLDPQDRRAIRVFLTEGGRTLASKIAVIGGDFNQRIQALLEPNNVQSFTDGLNNIYRGVDQF